MEDQNPDTMIIEPNPDFKMYAEIPPRIISDMLILHEYNVHYSLIIPEDSRLAENGGLDLQRSQNAKNVSRITKQSATQMNIKETCIQSDSDLNADMAQKSLHTKGMKTHTYETSMQRVSVVNADIAQTNSKPTVLEAHINETNMHGVLDLNADIVQKSSNTNVMKTHTNGKSILEVRESNADIAQENSNTDVMKTHTKEINMQKFESVQEKVTSLEQSLKLLLGRVEVLENENRLLKDKLNGDEKKNVEEECEGKSDEQENEEAFSLVLE